MDNLYVIYALLFLLTKRILQASVVIEVLPEYVELLSVINSLTLRNFTLQYH